jgi:TPR repeat protein
MYFLGMFYFEGVDGERDRKKAAQYFRRSADIGNVALAQFNLAQMLYRGDDIPQNYEEAFQYFKLCAEQGDSEAMLQLCKMYSNGEGVKQNHNEALRWAQMSANNGNVKGKQMVEALFNRN